MLVTLKEIMQIAEARKIAIGAFNTPNFESIRAVITAAEDENLPVIIVHAQLHEEIGLVKMEEITPIMLFMADKAKVPVCVHLDHGTDLDYIKKGLDLGYTSVMYDGSEEDMEINIANTCIVTSLAARYGASVEAEVGNMGAREGEGFEVPGKKESAVSIYTDPDVAKEFAKKTGVDALACAFGSVHGLYVKEPQLDFDRIKELKTKLSVPIVMHGGSGVSDDDFRKVIECGVRKVNYYTYMAIAGAEAVEKAERKMYFHDMAVAAERGMYENVRNAIRIFAAL